VRRITTLTIVGLALVLLSAGTFFAVATRTLPYSSFHWRYSGALLTSLRLRMLPSIDGLVREKRIHSPDTAANYLGSPTSRDEFTASDTNTRRIITTYRVDSRRALAFVFDDQGEYIYHELVDRIQDPSQRMVELSMRYVAKP
jgi:hypothetical protein